MEENLYSKLELLCTLSNCLMVSRRSETMNNISILDKENSTFICSIINHQDETSFYVPIDMMQINVEKSYELVESAIQSYMKNKTDDL